MCPVQFWINWYIKGITRVLLPEVGQTPGVHIWVDSAVLPGGAYILPFSGVGPGSSCGDTWSLGMGSGLRSWSMTHIWFSMPLSCRRSWSRASTRIFFFSIARSSRVGMVAASFEDLLSGMGLGSGNEPGNSLWPFFFGMVSSLFTPNKGFNGCTYVFPLVFAYFAIRHGICNHL